VVVGGGIAGCTVALELARQDLRVTLFESAGIASAASGLNAGVLLNQVEAQVVRIMRTSLEVYRELRSEHGFWLREYPQLLLAADEGQMELARARARGIQAVGVASQELGAADLRREFPQLADSVRGGFLVGEAWLLDPAGATRAFAEAARAAGAELRLGERVSSLRRQAGRVEGVVTDSGRMAADAVVLATGPWLPQLLPGSPVGAGRGWLMRTARLPFELPWIVEEMSWPDQDELGRVARHPTLGELSESSHDRPAVEAFVIVPQAAGEALIGTSLAPSLRDAVEGTGMPQRLAGRALRLAPGLREVAVTSAWSAMRPMTPDGMPIVGAGEDEGLFLHGGHGSIGMMAAPATARWLAQEILDGEAPLELAPLRPGRFVG